MNIMKCAVKINSNNNLLDIKTIITSFINKHPSAKLSVFDTPDDEIVFFEKNNIVSDYILFLSKIYTNSCFAIIPLSQKEKYATIIHNGKTLVEISERGI